MKILGLGEENLEKSFFFFFFWQIFGQMKIWENCNFEV